MALVIERPWTTQPLGNSSLNTRGPIRAPAFLYSPIGGIHRDWARGIQSSVASGTASDVNGLYCSGASGNYPTFPHIADIRGKSSISLYLRYRHSSDAAYVNFTEIFHNWDQGFYLVLWFGELRLYLNGGTIAGGYSITSGAGLAGTGWYDIVVSIDNGVTTCLINGVEVSMTDFSALTFGSGSSSVIVGANTGGNVSIAAVWPYALQKQEMLDLCTQRRWQLFAPRRFVVPIAAATGGAQTINVPVGALTLTGYVPIIATTDHQTVSVPAGSLSLTGYTPTVTTSNQQTISVPAGAITLTGYVPTVTATANWTINVPAEGLTLTGLAPTVASSGNQLISIPAGALNLTAYTPAVNVTENWNISVPAGAVTLTGYAPTIVSGGNQTISISVGNILLTGYAPSVTAGTNYVSVPLGSITLTGYAPTVGISGAVVTLKAGSWIRYRIIT